MPAGQILVSQEVAKDGVILWQCYECLASNGKTPSTDLELLLGLGNHILQSGHILRARNRKGLNKGVIHGVLQDSIKGTLPGRDETEVRC